MRVEPDGIAHITLRVTDLERSRSFYKDVLGFVVERFPDRCRFRVGETTVVLRYVLPGTPEGDRFSEHRVGFDHVAFGLKSREELAQALVQLESAGVATQGIQRFEDLEDPTNSRDLICFRDPDNIQLEFYMRKSR